ncbi:hypothetical protein J437_LFUL005910, partial [Ladona fulva]
NRLRRDTTKPLICVNGNVVIIYGRISSLIIYLSQRYYCTMEIGHTISENGDENFCPNLQNNITNTENIPGMMSDALIASTPIKLSLTKFCTPANNQPANRVVLKDISPIATHNAKNGEFRRVSPE